jgi:hypothetical protein
LSLRFCRNTPVGTHLFESAETKKIYPEFRTFLYKGQTPKKSRFAAMKIGVHFLHGKKMKLFQIKTQYEFFPGRQQQGGGFLLCFYGNKQKIK